jgi:hypothetical protein
LKRVTPKHCQTLKLVMPLKLVMKWKVEWHKVCILLLIWHHIT